MRGISLTRTRKMTYIGDAFERYKSMNAENNNSSSNGMQTLHPKGTFFYVFVRSTATINGVESNALTPREVLTEVYDAAEQFPVSITLELASGKRHSLSMDEHGTTCEVACLDVELNVEEQTGDNQEEELQEELAPGKPSAARKASIFANGRFNSKAVTMGGGAAVLLGFAVVLGIQLMDSNALTNKDSWQSALPETTIAQTPFSNLFGDKLWAIEPGEADSVSWFAAGVLQTNEAKNEITLRSLDSGKTVATYKAGKNVDLKKDLQWVSDLSYGDKPAVGIRIGKFFVAITNDGKVTKWDLPRGFEVSVRGALPLMSNVATQKEPSKVEHFLLDQGQDKPRKLTVNPELVTRSIDGPWIVQLDINKPLVALTPVDRGGKLDAHAVNLVSPNEKAIFVQHLAAGHQYSLALWEVQGQPYLGVHSLTGETPGMTTSFVPAPFTNAEAKGWSVTSGAELAILGPYAFSLETGKLDEYSPDAEFSRGYGQIAVSTDKSGGRNLTIDHIQYPEVERIVGYSDQGIALVRLIDGSVAAYKTTENKD